MHPFNYKFATQPQLAIKAVGTEPNAVFLAGGTSLIDLMKLHVENPDTLIDINDLPLSKITEIPYGGIRIGALVKNSDCAHSEIIRERYPVLSEAILAGASPQLRNMATTGGNLLQKTRCYYYRDSTQPCNKREPGSGCPAIVGINRMHAVLGTSKHCIATNPSDMAVALTALDAQVVTLSGKGERRIPIDSFFLLPEDHPERETVLYPGELIIGVDLAPLPFARRSHYLKVRDRASYAFALASAAVALDIQGGLIKEARIVMGGVGTRPWRAYEAEAVLKGKPAGQELFKAAAEAALSGAIAYKDNGFKIVLAKRIVVRALTTVSGMPA